ncbi:hypothetical protein E2C01_065573 [Portunus trituberculatus]|uniref:Uncharacterized protein n=1 Tax=Portunus trituberculatus TaxID=210409 RepID=A0A5B7HNK4_PORTR|nr:hypothetical protein [Portunus trituberculatus]
MGDPHNVCVCVCVCVLCNSPQSSAGHPASLPHYRASSELIDRSSCRTETTSHTTHTGEVRPQPLRLHPVATYLLLGEQGPHLACPFASPLPGTQTQPSRL